MSRNTRSDHKDAQLRRTAVKRYRAGIPPAEVARQLHRSRSWVYKWVQYRNQHPWTRFRSASRASLHHPNQLSAKSERRIVRLRQLLMRHRQPRLRFALVGARTIQKEWRRRYPEPPPSLRTIQRVLKRHHLTSQAPKPCHHAYRPHPDATYPDAVHATDIITRWITGGEVVQTFNTVDIYSNDVCSTSHANKTAAAACDHLLQTWQQLGVPDIAQFDNESEASPPTYPSAAAIIPGCSARWCACVCIWALRSCSSLYVKPITTHPLKPSTTCGHNDSGGFTISPVVAMSHGFSAPFSLGTAVSTSPRASPIRLSGCGRGLGCVRSQHATPRAYRVGCRSVRAAFMRCAASRQRAGFAFSINPFAWANATVAAMSGLR